MLLDLRKIQVLGWFCKLGEQQQEIQGAADEMNLEEQPLKSLSEDLLSLLVNGQAFSDVTFAVEGRHVYAHKCVLAARSPFFRMIFCGNAQQMQMWDDDHQHHHHAGTVPQTTTTTAAAAIHVAQQAVIPVGIVGHDVFMLLLQFLYSGTLSFSPQNHVSSLRSCKEKGCWHTHCTSAVEFALETLNAAHFFGMDQLSTLTQVRTSLCNFLQLIVELDFEEDPNLSVCLSASFVLVAGIDQFLELSRFCSLLLTNS